MTHTVAHVRTNDEEAVAKRLLERGVSSWYPKGTRKVSNGRQRRLKVERPAFPGYLFVEVETIQYPDLLKDVAGFYDFVRYQGEWATITSDVLDEIRAMEAMDLFSDKPVRRPKLKIGDIVTIPRDIKDPLCGRKGQVVEQQGDDVWLEGYDIKMKVRISGLKLLRGQVECSA